MIKYHNYTGVDPKHVGRKPYAPLCSHWAPQLNHKLPKQQLQSLETMLQRLNHPSNLDFDAETAEMEEDLAQPVFSSGPLGKRADGPSKTIAKRRK